MKQRYDVIEWDGTIHSVFASGHALIKVAYCGGTIHEVTKNYFEKVLQAKLRLRCQGNCRPPPSKPAR